MKHFREIGKHSNRLYIDRLPLDLVKALDDDADLISNVPSSITGSKL